MSKKLIYLVQNVDLLNIPERWMMDQSHFGEIEASGLITQRTLTMKKTTKTSAAQFNQLVNAYLAAKQHSENTPWGYSEEEKAAYNAAKQRLDEATQSLREAVMAQVWGQNGSIFITDRRYSWSDNSRIRRLYINNRCRAVVKYRYQDVWLQEVLTSEQAEEKREADKARQKAWQQQYDTERQILIAELQLHGVNRCRSFGPYKYYDGQEGGVFKRDDSEMYIGAEGALRGAWGEGWREQVDAGHQNLESEWDRKIYNTRY